MSEQRCGYCRGKGKSGTNGKIFPVIVQTRGKTVHSWAHLRCYTKWQKVSDVRYDTENQPHKELVEDAMQRQKQRSRLATLRTVLRRSNQQKQCVGCGYPIDLESERCPECAGKYRSSQRPKQIYRCVCGAGIVRQATHCPTCSAIRRENLKYERVV